MKWVEGDPDSENQYLVLEEHGNRIGAILGEQRGNIVSLRVIYESGKMSHRMLFYGEDKAKAHAEGKAPYG